MKRILRFLMLTVLFLPFALQAQNTLTVADGTTTNSNVPIYGLWADAYLRCQTIYPAAMLDAAATTYGMTGGSITSVTYYMSSPAAEAWTGTWEVKMMEVAATTLSAFVDMTNATTVYTGTLDGTTSPMTITFTTPYTYTGGNLLIEVSETTKGNYKSASFYGETVSGASWQGYNSTAWSSITGSAQNFMPKTTFTFTGGGEITCRPVQNLSIDATQTTSSSLTITWSDALNTGATYTIYDMADNSIIYSGITDNTYTISGLNANTVYTFGVEANCSATDASSVLTVSGRTDCAPLGSLPFTEDFENIPSGSYQMPYCWSRYISANTSSTPYPYSYSGNAHSGSRSLYFYGTTGDAYPDTMMAIMPELDVTMYPMSGNRVTFWAKMGTASNSKNVYVGTMTDPNDPSTFTLVDSVLVNGNVHTKYSVPMTNATDAYVAFMVFKGTGSMYIDDVTLEEMPSCVEISGLTANGITSSSVTLTWIDGNNSGATYSVYDMADTTLLMSGITDLTYTITDLTPNTEYVFGVQANCSTEDASFTTTSARTSCAPEELPFSETFDATLSNDPCWRGATGTTADEVLAGSVLTLTANSQWTYTSSESNGIAAGHYLVNIYGSSCKKWMITPDIDLSDATSPLLSFDAAFTVYSGTGAATGFESNTSQAFMILVSTDGAQTWTLASNISLTSIASSTYMPQYIDLSAYAGETVRIAFYAQSTTSGGDNNLHIDNILIEESTGDLCLPVTNLAANNITDEGATLTWTGTADNYNIYDMSDTSIVASVSATTYDLTNLTAMTSYSYGVAADCGSNVSVIMSISFNTACTAISLPYTETFEATSSTVSCWSIEGNGNWTIGTGDYSAATGAFEGSLNAKITHSTTGNVTKLISPIFDNVQNGMILDFAYVLRSWSGDIDELRVYSRADASSAWQQVAEFTDATDIWTVENIVILGNVYQIAFEHTDNYGYGLGIDSVVFTAMTGDYCYPVSNLAANNVTSTSVSLSWSDENNSGATYTIYDMADNSVIASGVTTTSYDVTGLTATTGYTFGVVANCSAADESSIATVNVATACDGTTCNITITGYDSFGDGWNGYAINVMQAGVVIGTFTLTNGDSLTESFPVCGSTPVSFSGVAGQYPGEISFEIFMNGNFSVFTGAGSLLTSGAVFFTLDNACSTCMPVTGLTVDAATETSITISWTGTAASYDVYEGENFVANVTTTSYTFTGLTAATAYTFGIVANCSATEASIINTINAMTSCADITTLPYNESFENDLGCWTTINGSSDGQPWFTYDCAALSSVEPHSGSYVASSWSWNTSAMHANAWLISPKFILPTTNDALTFSWWDITSTNYPDKYSVVLSTTTNDTAAFTTTVYPYTAATGDWTIHTIDLTSYAGQSIYIAFHHVDYDENYLLIDDISLFEGGYVPPAPDTLTVTFAVNNATMGTTNPVPGTYQYITGDTVRFTAIPNTGYRFAGWEWVTSIGVDTLGTQYISAYFPANAMMQYGSMTLTALFEVGNPDSTTITYAVNDATMGTISPAPGTYTIYVGGSIDATATPNTGYVLSAWMLDIYLNGSLNSSDTILSSDADFSNPMHFGTLPQSFADYNATITITAVFAPASVNTYTVTVNVNNSSMGTATGGGTFNDGSQATVSATANAGYHFVAWMNGTTQVSTANPYTFTVNSNITLTATFEADPVTQYTVTLNTADATMGTVNPAGASTVNEGSSFTATATAADGFHFVAWMNGTAQVSTANPYTFTVTGNITLTATFEANDPGITYYEVTVTSADPNMGNVSSTASGSVAENTEVTVTATPAENYHFVNWIDRDGNVVSEANPYTFTVTADIALIATFAPNVGINDIDASNVLIYANNSTIYVRGAESHNIFVYDMNGRCIYQNANANETETISMSCAGIYLVRIDNAIFKKVVIVR